MKSWESNVVSVGYSAVHREREYTAALIFSFSFPCFSRRFKWSVFCFFLQTCPVLLLFILSVEAKYQLGNITEVCEKRTALASIHARSTPDYLWWNCDPSPGTAHAFPVYTFFECFHVRTRYFEDILGKMLRMSGYFAGCQWRNISHRLHEKYMRRRAWTCSH